MQYIFTVSLAHALYDGKAIGAVCPSYYMSCHPPKQPLLEFRGLALSVANQNTVVLISRTVLIVLFPILVVLGLFKVLCLDVAVFVVAVWFLNGVGHCVENTGGFLENVIHLLQGTQTSLWEEEIYTGKHESVTWKVSIAAR